MNQLRILHSLAGIPPQQWDALAGGSICQPFLRHAFLSALEETGCVSTGTGWQPQHLTLWRDKTLVAAMPLYIKQHSFGEYVFDWAWAEACERHGLAYYPKLLSAIPFTPVQGQRLLAVDEASRNALLDVALSHAQASAISSLHVLFPTPEEAVTLASRGLLLRHGVQFHWRNAEYRDFQDFLETLERDKRKKIRQERRRVEEAGIRFRHQLGSEISDADRDFFYRCYARTYRQHRSTPYLSPEFFARIGATLAENLLLVIAERDGRPIAAAFNVFDAASLYGRYWGALEYVPALHFEACYYQAIEFCIARGIQTFEGGAQGEHKLARGLLPVCTASAHWLRDARFTSAVADYLARERGGVEQYVDELNERSPFK